MSPDERGHMWTSAAGQGTDPQSSLILLMMRNTHLCICTRTPAVEQESQSHCSVYSQDAMTSDLGPPHWGVEGGVRREKR